LKTKYNFIGDNTISEYVTIKAENKNTMRELFERVEKHSAKLMSGSVQPAQILMPDTLPEGFAEECHRQSALLMNDQHEHDIMQFLNEAADREGWTA